MPSLTGKSKRQKRRTGDQTGVGELKRIRRRYEGYLKSSEGEARTLRLVAGPMLESFHLSRQGVKATLVVIPANLETWIPESFLQKGLGLRAFE